MQVRVPVERVDHLEPDQVRELVAGTERQHGRLDLLVVGLFGADLLTTLGTRLWEHDLAPTGTADDVTPGHDVVGLDVSRPDAWRCVVEVQGRGLPADVTGYR